jgi:hypothetical protein
VNKIIDRIQKLLRLAQNAGSEAEAALAAQRAADMMAEHEIHEAELALANDAETRQAEPIEKCFEVTKTSKRVAWHMRVTNAVARTYGSMAYWQGGRVVLFGRLSAVQAVNYTSHYLMREIEKMTDREAPTSTYSRTYRNAFRLGCANEVANRLALRLALEEQKRKEAAYQAAMAATMAAQAEAETDDVVSEDDLDAAVEDEIEDEKSEPTPVPNATPANTMALAIVERDREEVKKEYENFSRKWRSGAAIGKISNGSGYSAGRAAGGRVNLGGKSKGALPKGNDVLKRGAA